MSPAATPANHTSCQVRNFVVFAPGFWKGTLYSPAQVANIVSNFALFKPHLTPTVKIGHDREQLLQERLKQSTGFLNIGQVENVRLTPSGCVSVDLVNVPVDVGGAINAGWINSASVELKPNKPSPDDASEIIDGPILTAVALLGEENPALQDKRLSVPHAVFPDGSEVPPAAQASKWLNLMSDVQVAKSTATPETGESFSLCFSDYTPEAAPVDPKIQALVALGMTPEMAAQAVQICSGGEPGPTDTTLPPKKEEMAATPPPTTQPATMPTETMSGASKYSAFAETCKKFADDPAATDKDKAFSAAFSALFADMEEKDKQFADQTKRMGDMEAATTAKQKEGEKAEMSAFTAEYDATFARLDGARKLPPIEAKAIREKDLELAGTKAFSTADSRKGIIDSLTQRLKSLPVDQRLAKPVTNLGPDGKPLPKPPVEPTPTLNALIGPGSFLAGQVNTDAMRQRLNVANAG